MFPNKKLPLSFHFFPILLFSILSTNILPTKNTSYKCSSLINKSCFVALLNFFHHPFLF